MAKRKGMYFSDHGYSQDVKEPSPEESARYYAKEIKGDSMDSWSGAHKTLENIEKMDKELAKVGKDRECVEITDDDITERLRRVIPNRLRFLLKEAENTTDDPPFHNKYYLGSPEDTQHVNKSFFFKELDALLKVRDRADLVTIVDEEIRTTMRRIWGWLKRDEVTHEKAHELLLAVRRIAMKANIEITTAGISEQEVLAVLQARHLSDAHRLWSRIKETRYHGDVESLVLAMDAHLAMAGKSHADISAADSEIEQILQDGHWAEAQRMWFGAQQYRYYIDALSFVDKMMMHLRKAGATPKDIGVRKAALEEVINRSLGALPPQVAPKKIKDAVKILNRLKEQEPKLEISTEALVKPLMVSQNL